MTSGPEHAIKANILLALGARPDVRLFNNPVGLAYTGEPSQRGNSLVLMHARPVRYGLAPGSSDLVGWTTVTITPDMVGRQLAVFTAVECKAPRGRGSAPQRQFIDIVRRFGGIAGIARSPEEAAALVAAGPACPTKP